ncbi:Protein casc3 [Gryllus bimaculatus]|nr:Protein casc3 [Gryllus bimaculatus]
MSVVARRRKPRVSGDSEEFSEDSYDDNDANKGSEGDTDLNASSEGLRESEYETLDEAGESESEGTTAVDEEREGEEGEEGEGELSDSVIIEYEREEGDGQESAPPKEKKLDDDEDRRNPQYIPKRGTFYEHDDRTAVEDTNEEEVEKETERNKENEKKKVWKEHENRWSHDRYNEEDQTPKSRDELIAIYGYDIRNEDAPPRARRRRKYGKEDSAKEDKNSSISSGPSTPNVWKKDNSQNKADVVKNREDAQKLAKDNVKNVAANVSGNSSVPPFTKTRTAPDEKREKVEENGWKPRRDRSRPRPVPEDAVVMDSANSNSGWRNKNKGERRGTQIPVESLTFTPSAPRGRGRGRGERGGGPGRQTMEFKPSSGTATTESSRRSVSETRMSSQEQGNGAEGPYIKSQVVNRTTDDMTKELSHVSISEHQPPLNNREYPKKTIKNNPPNYHQVPPRMQESAANKPKRYSSQRQRSLPETGATATTYAQPHGYYPPAGYAQPPEELEGMGVVSSGYVPPPPVYGDAQQQPPPPAVVAQAPATTPPLALLPPPHPQAQAYAAPPFSSPPTFIPPPVAGPPPRILPPGAATYMTAAPTGAPIINYVATPAQNQFAPQAYAPFQGYTAVPATQPPPELFQPQGITYYSPEEQLMPRTITQKRQSTAIPIVPPPEKGPRGRGRLREEVSGGTTPVGDPGAGGDATSSALKEAQMEDAPEIMKTELVIEEPGNSKSTIDPVPEASQETRHEEISKKTVVSPEIIEAINVTEIPESAEAVEAAKSIIAAEAASSQSNAVSSCIESSSTTESNTTSSNTNETDAAPVSVTSAEQVTQA